MFEIADQFSAGDVGSKSRMFVFVFSKFPVGDGGGGGSAWG